MLQGRPDDTQSALVSKDEATLIRVDGNRIRKIFGTEGDFTVIPDPGTGSAYIKPLTEKQVFSAYVTDDANRTWKLLLGVKAGPVDSITIKGRGGATNLRLGKDLARNQAIKRVILQLESADDEDSTPVHKVIPLWAESSFVKVKELDGPVRGEKYVLTNQSPRRMVIDERELFRKSVMAISVETPVLQPGESTYVYVVNEVKN